MDLVKGAVHLEVRCGLLISFIRFGCSVDSLDYLVDSMDLPFKVVKICRGMRPGQESHAVGEKVELMAWTSNRGHLGFSVRRAVLFAPQQSVSV